jgi:hypothetical protein
MATQSAVWPNLTVANGASSAMGLGAAATLEDSQPSASAWLTIKMRRFIVRVCTSRTVISLVYASRINFSV